jgi:hypothetical protein
MSAPQITAQEHLENLAVQRDEFLYHWKLNQLEDHRLDKVAAAMGWMDPHEVETEFSKDFSSDTFLVVNTALLSALNEEIFRLISTGKISLSLCCELASTLFVFRTMSELVILTSANGSVSLSEAQAQQVEEYAETLDALIEGTLSDKERLYIANLINDIMENSYRVLDATFEDENEEDTD